jgi:hypothetical protein
MFLRIGIRKTMGAAALLAAMCLMPHQASAGLLCGVGSLGFGCGGPGVADLSGTGPVNIFNPGLSFTFADGLVLGFDISEQITGNLGGGATTSAWIKITNLYAANVGPGFVNDTFYIFSDVFNPGVAGTAGVGTVGIYGATPGVGVVPVAGVYGASSQAQMNYLLAPLVAPGAAPGLSLTAPQTFGVGLPGAPVVFYSWARTPIGAGTRQLVGALNFQLDPFSEVYMPGSLIVDENDSSEFLSEVPEPATLSFMGLGLAGLGLYRRRRTQK